MKLSKLINTVLILMCVSVIACANADSIVDRVIPADVAPRSATYAGQDPNHLYNLHQAKGLKDEIDIVHRDTQLDLKRLSEDDTYAWQDATGFIDTAISEAELLKNTIIGDDNNPLSVSGLLFMLTGGLVGRSFFKRPGDLTPEEAKAKGAVV